MSEFDTGYSVVIGKPVVHAEKKATGSSVSFPCDAIPDGSYLVSIEVNGSVKAYRESLEFSSGSCTVGEYTLSYSSYALTVSGTSNNDIVRVMVEPLEVKTTDAFRAAVKKDAPVTPNELPAVASTDRGKFLHTNESTGALEWAEGGSGGLPTPTAEDVGKVATVVEEISKGTVIAAEQTVLLNDKTGKGYIDNVDKSLMTNGAILIVTIDDVEYVVMCVADPIIEPITCGSFTIENSSESTLLISALGVEEPIDVAINLGVASYSWQPAVSGGGVLVVHATLSDDTYTLDKTWQEIYDADYAVIVDRGELGITYGTILSAQYVPPLNKYTVGISGLFEVDVDFESNSASGYPTYTDE